MSFQRIRSELAQEVHTIETMMANLLLSSNSLTNAITEYVISTGGKRIRPIIAIICAKMLDCRNSHYMEIAAAIECIHTATLLHDDVIDNSTIRRSSATTNVVWGNQLSVLSGDFLFSKAFQLVVKTGVPEVIELISSVASKIVEGEINQLHFLRSGKFPSEDDYNSIISSKTGELFAAAVENAAILSNADMQTRRISNKIGLSIGNMYQIADDWLDYFPNNIGTADKNIAADLLEGKITLPIIMLRNASISKDEQDIILKIFSNRNNLDSDHLQIIQELLIKYRIKSSMLDKMHAMQSEIHDIISYLWPNNEYATMLKDIIKYLIERLDEV